MQNTIGVEILGNGMMPQADKNKNVFEQPVASLMNSLIE
jgi:hypothetical protein